MKIIAYFKHILSYRYLLFNLVVKDFKTRYKTASLGFLWVVLTPLFMMAILSFVFSKIVKIDVQDFSIFLLCGILPWSFTSISLFSVTTSIVDNSNLIKKVAFPKIMIPVSIVCSNGIFFLFSLLILLVFIIFSNVSFTASLFFIPVVFAIQFVFILGLSLLAVTLHVRHRDVKYVVELFLLGWFYLTPIFYPASLVPDRFRDIYMLNPMASIIIMYRDLLLYGKMVDFDTFVYSLSVSIVLFILALVFFQKKEKNFADII
jgi:lipopolysaccharide transport system permease protein